MATVIIQPAGGRESREHYAATIQKPVPLDRLEGFLSALEIAALRVAYGGTSVPTWGVTPSDRRAGRREWDQMQPGDIVLFTGGKKVYAGGIIAYRAHNAPLARDLWGTDKKNRTWEYVYFLKDIFELSIPYAELNHVLGYRKNFVPQGILALDPTRSEKMIDTFHLDEHLAVETEVNEARSVISESAGKPAARQGFRVSAIVRRAIENQAMKLAINYCAQQGWDVEDVSRQQSYDLRCRRKGQELHVEVKGTTSEGHEVLLTPNEVSHAREVYPNVMLLIVSQIRVSTEGVAKGGNVGIFNPWAIDQGQLEPLGYTYAVPAGAVAEVDPGLFGFLAQALAIASEAAGTLAATPLGVYLSAAPKRQARRSLKKMRDGLARSLSLIDRLEALAQAKQKLDLPIGIVGGNMTLNHLESVEARDIWRELSQTARVIYDSSLDLTSFYYREGAPIESKIEQLCARIDKIMFSASYGHAIGEIRDVVKQLHEYVDDAWKALNMGRW